MKKRFFVFLIALLLCVMPFLTNENNSVVAEEVNKQIVTVTGVGEVIVSPDYAIINVGVNTLKDTLVDADKENNDIVKAIISVLNENGINSDNMKTSYYFVDKRYDYSEGQKFLGYEVHNSLEIKTSDINNIDSLLTKLVSAGANHISGITFKVEDYKSNYNKALALALEDAKSKAKAIAGENVTMGEIVEEYYCYYSNDFVTLKEAKTDSSSIVAGDITVKAGIKVDFNY